MARCKYCHENITRLDRDVCPFCGGLKPLEGTDDSTQDITKVIDDVQNAEPVKYHSKIAAAILAILFGVFGIDSFYLGRVKTGLIKLLVSLVFVGGLGSLIYFLAWPNVFAYLIFYFVIEAFMIVVGVCYLVKHNITDSNGAFLK